MRRRTKWQDIKVTLHIPRALIFYCFILWGFLLGAGAPIHLDRLFFALLAAHFYLQWSSYALDELRGRHCDTHLSETHLRARIIIGLLVFISLGTYFSLTVSWTLLPLLYIGVILVAFYNYEILAFHNRIVFGFAWGAFPILAHNYFNTLALPNFEVLAFSLVAAIFAYQHIIMYGNYFCGVEQCVELNQYRMRGKPLPHECHGQFCYQRRNMPRPVHKLQKKISKWNTLVAVAITLALIVQRLIT